MTTTFDRIQLNRKTAAQWTAGNLVLLPGEAGVELDTGKVKFGDGTTGWTGLPYSAGDVTAGVASVNGRTGTVTLTKTDVALSNVDNTSDAAKPVSTAQAAALALKVTAPTGGVDGQAIVKSGTGWALATITGGSGAPLPAARTVTASSYVFVLADAENVVEYTGSSISTFTVPTHTAVPFQVGPTAETNIVVRLYGPGSIVLAGASGVVLRSPGNAFRLTTQYAQAVLTARGTNEWLVSGLTVV